MALDGRDWVGYVRQLADRLEKASSGGRLCGTVISDPRALRDCATFLEELWRSSAAPKLAVPTGKPEGVMPTFRDHTGIVWDLVERSRHEELVERVEALEGKLANVGSMLRPH